MSSIRLVASLIGVLVHAFHAIVPGPLHYRTLERDKVAALRMCSEYSASMSLSTASICEIRWWIENVVLLNGKLIRRPPIDLWIECDASLKGWGVSVQSRGTATGGAWSQLEAIQHINYLELLATFLGLKTFFSDSENIHIGVKSDSSTAVYYLNAMGGMASLLLDDLTKEIWEWCFSRNIFITAQHIPGILNVEADKWSREFVSSAEWKLKPCIFTRLCSHFFTPDVDLFASRLNNQIPRYFSWLPDPGAFRVDAFMHSWSSLQPYIFPPFSILGRVLIKITEDEVDKAIIVVPFWPSQHWYPLLLAALVSFPVRLPHHRDLLTLTPDGSPHPLRRLCLIACEVSGKACRRMAFHDRLLKLYPPPGDQAQGSNMIWRGGDGCCGQLNEVSIPFIPLSRK